MFTVILVLDKFKFNVMYLMYQMFPIIVDCVNETLIILDEKHETGKPFDIHR